MKFTNHSIGRVAAKFDLYTEDKKNQIERLDRSTNSTSDWINFKASKGTNGGLKKL
jgi:hypothetical protein